jgi:TolB-like protein/tetratricopeptide (TPR) repeat protein
LAEPLVAEHHGRVVKLTGDGALVEFASAVDAVECAVAIQAGMAEREAAEPEERRIRYRIGINIGDIVLEDGDIFGDGVNVAARLEGLAEPGGICVARNVYNQVEAKLHLAFEPMGDHRVKNIAKPITVYRVLPRAGARPETGPAAIAWALRRHRPTAIAAAVAVVLAAGAAGVWYALWRPSAPPPAAVAEIAGSGGAQAKPALPLPDKPSIAVLPFDNLSGERRYERLADGITEDIITDLSRFHDLFVIARNSTEVYKGQPVDVRQVAGALGVQYILEGSLQTDGTQVRITAQLIDASTGNHVWSERYDRPLDDIFALQDEVTQTVAASLAGQYGVVATAGREVARRKPPESLAAYDLYLIGLENKHLYTKQGNLNAQELARKAIKLDPGSARAYVLLAWAYNLEIDNGWTDSWQRSMDNWLAASKAALAADPSDAEAHLTLGTYYQYSNNYARAVAEVEQALTLNPNNADVLAIAGGGMLPWLGRPEQAAELVERAARLNPLHPDWYLLMIEWASFYVERYKDVIAVTDKKATPVFYDHVYRALSFAQLGDVEQANAERARVLDMNPDYSAERSISNLGSYSRDTELNLFLDSHKKAGLPLCATAAQLAKYPDMKRLEQCEAQRASG